MEVVRSRLPAVTTIGPSPACWGEQGWGQGTNDLPSPDMKRDSNGAASVRPQRAMFVGLGLALVLVGVVEIALGHLASLGWTIHGVSIGGLAMVASGTMAIVVANRLLQLG